ncbi:MAG: hypothetical protein M3O71_18805 [Bacteroidota bacterium]|nr:hypothetical protein [Bacteroidota bacterium]
MCKINEAGCDDTFSYSDNYSASQLHELERVWLAYKDDTALYGFVNKEAEWIEQCWIKNKGGDDIDWPEEIAVQTVWDTYYFLRKCLDMKAVINEENTNIVMIYG